MNYGQSAKDDDDDDDHCNNIWDSSNFCRYYDIDDIDQSSICANDLKYTALHLSQCSESSEQIRQT